MACKQYRVVVDGIGRRSGSVSASPLAERELALAGFDAVCEIFREDVAAGDMRVSVLAEDEWARREQR